MTNPQARLIDLQERLLACGADVPARAEAFARERAALLAELESALSWRGVLARGPSAARLAPLVDGLCARAADLRALGERIGQLEESLAAAEGLLGRVAASALRDPGALPARLVRLRAEAAGLGRRVVTDGDLSADADRCEVLRAEVVRLAEGLTLMVAAEETLGRLRSSPRTAALEASLPDLAGRLCRDGPTPDWMDELRALLAPLDRLMHRAQPREISETEKIVKALPRWARALGEPPDAGEALAERFKARRRDWPGEDDRTFQTLFEQARALEQGLMERAALVRRDGIEDLEGRCARFAALVEPDANLAALTAELRDWTPEDPRDHEDWCTRLREARAAFRTRVKRSENALIEALGEGLDECRRRLAALEPEPRLAGEDAELVRLRDRCAALGAGGADLDPETLLGRVEAAGDLRLALDDLALLIRTRQSDLARSAADLDARARWLTEQAARFGVRLPGPLPGSVSGVDGDPSGDAQPRTVPPTPGPRAAVAGLEALRCDLEARAGYLAAAEDALVRALATAAAQFDARMAGLLAHIDPERARAAGLVTGLVAPDGADTTAMVAGLESRQARLAVVLTLAAAEESALIQAAADLSVRLTGVDPDRLGQQDRADRETVLSDLANSHTGLPEDPAARLEVLRGRVENARHLERRISAAARRLTERRADLEERLRRFNDRLLGGHCPDLYARVEALVLTPAGTRWPRGAEEAQLAEAARLLGRLERTAGRLAARSLAETAEALERRVLRGGDAAERALLDEVLALPPECPPTAGLRRRLADWALGAGEGGG